MSSTQLLDCTIYAGEQDLLLLRLNELEPLSTHHIITECAWSFSNRWRGLHFPQIIDGLGDFKSKITYLPILSYPKDLNDDNWAREAYVRNYALSWIHAHYKPDDFVLVCDMDEIPRMNTLKIFMASPYLQQLDGPLVLDMDFYYYNFHWRQPSQWTKAFGCRVRHLTNIESQRMIPKKATLKDAGWHLSYFGSVGEIREKLQNFSHSEYNTPEYTSDSYISTAITQGLDLFKNVTLIPADVDAVKPKHAGLLRKNLPVSAHLLSPVTSKTMTVVLQGGLGNQLFELAALYSYAHLYSYKPIVKHVTVVVGRENYWASIFHKIPDTELTGTWQTVTEYESIDPATDHVRLLGHFQTVKHLTPYRDKVLELFTLPVEQMRYIDSLWSSDNRKRIAVHVRRGDYLVHSHVLTNLSLTYYWDAFNQIDKLVAGPKCLCIFSDDLDWCRVQFPKAFPDQTFKFIDGGSEVIDLMLMSKADGYVIANSTFSWWGWYLNPRAYTVPVIAPRQWRVSTPTDILVTDHFTLSDYI